MATALDVLDIGRTLGEDGTWYPTARVDVDARRDVADLARVHALEGIGDLTTSVAIDGGRLLLGVEVHHPVRCSFAVALRSPDHLPLLVDAASSGHLLLATTPPDAEGRPPWLALRLDPAQLLAGLQALVDRGPGRPAPGGGPGTPG